MQNHLCQAKSITDLSACQDCGINQICCKECFKVKHRNQDKTFHQEGKLVDSDFYKNFLKLIHIQWLVGQKVLKSLGSFNIANQQTKIYLVNAAFYGSDFYKEFFQQQKSPEQYVLLKSLYSGSQISFQSLSGLEKILNEAKYLDIITKHISKLTQLTEQEKLMNSHLDFYTGASSYYLEEFVAFEQQIITWYIQQLKSKVQETQQQQQKQVQPDKLFSIYQYLEWRQKHCDKQRNPIYYSKEFTAFLVEYYRKDASQKGIYSINHYVLNYWEYFNTSVQLNPTLKTYFDSEVQFYHTYQKLMTQNGLSVTYLGFKIWKLSNGVSKQLPYLKNHYFLFAFIEGYLKMLIERTYVFLSTSEKQQYAKQSWVDFLNFLKDYTYYIQDKQTAFDLDGYKSYYLYRKRIQPFHNVIKSSKDNIYDKDIAVKFFNHYFENTNLILKPKLYRQFFQKHQTLIKEKESSLFKQIQNLKQQLQQQQKQSFYEFIYVNFVAYCKELDILLKKQTYFAYKKNVLEAMDETYIQETEERYKRGDFNLPEEQQQETEQNLEKPVEPKFIIGQTGAKITVGMDKYEEQILQDNIHEQQQSQGQEKECPCCHGDSYACQNQQCQIMGYCTACSFET